MLNLATRTTASSLPLRQQRTQSTTATSLKSNVASTSNQRIGVVSRFASSSPSTPSRTSTSTKIMAFNLPSLPSLFGGQGGGKGNAAKRESLKQELLAAIAPLDRGAKATEQDKEQVARKFAALEKLNPTPSSLASPLLNGRWRLLYTTSSSILGTTRPAAFRPRGPIYQLLDGPSLRAKNRETFPFYNAVEAKLVPETKSRVAVQFKRFFIFGLIPVTAPKTARGKLDVTYLDQKLRLSRGDKGNIFILEMDDSSDRP